MDWKWWTRIVLIFLQSCEIKSGSGLGTRLLHLLIQWRLYFPPLSFSSPSLHFPPYACRYIKWEIFTIILIIRVTWSGIHMIFVVGYGWSKVAFSTNSPRSSSSWIIWTCITTHKYDTSWNVWDCLELSPCTHKQYTASGYPGIRQILWMIGLSIFGLAISSGKTVISVASQTQPIPPRIAFSITHARGWLSLGCQTRLRDQVPHNSAPHHPHWPYYCSLL